MGHPDADWCLPAIRGIDRAAWEALLDRAAEVGLLTPHGSGYYTIHPALPWFFRDLFAQHWTGGEAATQPSPQRAFVEAMGALGAHYHEQYVMGNRDVIALLAAEEANLLHARSLARQHGWDDALTSTMQGIYQLYGHTGRRAEWARLVQEIVPDFIDPNTDGPRAGREEQWALVTQYRVGLAQEARDWAGAARLQRAMVDWWRERATPLLALEPAALSSAQRNSVRWLAVSLVQLGHIQRGQGSAECAASYEEALRLSEHIGEQAGAAICAFNLGHAYKDLPALRDLDAAEHWYRRSLELTPEADRLQRAKSIGQLGYVAWERFKEARAAGAAAEVLAGYLSAAAQQYQQALAMTPPDAIGDRAVMHNMLGVIYKNAGRLDEALHHYRESIRYKEASGNLYGAARTRRNVAVTLRDAGNLHDALLYARAAVEGFAQFGERAGAEGEKAKRTLAGIEAMGG